MLRVLPGKGIMFGQTPRINEPVSEPATKIDVSNGEKAIARAPTGRFFENKDNPRNGKSNLSSSNQKRIRPSPDICEKSNQEVL